MNSVGFAGQHTAKLRKEPMAPVSWRVKNAIRPAYWGGWMAVQAAKAFSKLTGIPTITSQLSCRLINADGVTNYGVVGYRVVTTAFVNYMVDQLQTETSTWGDFKYHDSGVGTTAAAVGDTAIETTDAVGRATGTQAEGASANIYSSVGTITYGSTLAITEHGLFNDATTGTLLDRTVFSAINVVDTNSIEHTYQLTVTAGG